MGRSYRTRPQRLAPKLQAIRRNLGLTQAAMIGRLSANDEPLYPASISEYENGKREPSLLVLLRYARLVNLPMEVLVDDEMEMPQEFNQYLESQKARRSG